MKERCKGITKSGKPCSVASQLVGDSGFCRSHDPELADAKRLQSLRGGHTTAKRFKPGITPEELGPLETAADAQRWLRLVAQAVGSRHLTHAEGNSITRSVSEWLRAQDLRLAEERVSELERELTRFKGKKANASGKRLKVVG